jgi:CelD/BcsL family acetyltransferase involved in cellulose biosynthesis
LTLKVEVIDDRAGLLDLGSEWNSLLERSSSNNPFLTWEWVSTWWDVYGAQASLHVLTARDAGGALVGLAPLKRVRRRLFGALPVRVAEFIGDGGDVTPEYLDFVVAPGHERLVVAGFADHLMSDDRIGGVSLGPLAEASSSLVSVQETLRARGCYVAVAPEAACPVLDLPPTYDAFLAGRSRNYRKKIGEYARRGVRDLGLQLRQTASADELDADMATLVRLHHLRWNGRSRAFRTPEYVEFHRRLARRFLERGWMRLLSLEGHQGPVAVLYCFAYNRRYYYYQAGRDPERAQHRVGLVLMHQAIRRAIEEGAVAFDFLRGREAYKYRWAHVHSHSVRLAFWKGVLPVVASRVAAQLTAAKTLVFGTS